jgi:hypothetical protein
MHPIDPQELYDAYHPPKSPKLELSYDTLCDDIDAFAPFSYTLKDLQRRTLYFGNLPPTISFEMFLNHITGGVIEQVKILHDKQCAFVTFLEPDAAANLHSESQNKRFVIQGYDVRVGIKNLIF